jgi:outer membrane protein TolC
MRARAALPKHLELGLVRANRDELLAVVRLYRALGGGWQE